MNVLVIAEDDRNDLGEEAASNYSRVRQNCPELRELEVRIQEWLS